jgi:Enoyl-CoA hydratase/isomerase
LVQVSICLIAYSLASSEAALSVELLVCRLKVSKRPFLPGAGIDMITAADIRCCTEGATFCVKEIDLGITADLGTLQRLFRLVGEGAFDCSVASWACSASCAMNTCACPVSLPSANLRRNTCT